MSEFEQALLSSERNPALPEEDDWYAPLLGDWDFLYTEPDGREVQGEWLFRRVLDGMAIEDLFLCPSRATKDSNPQPDGEYGAAIRMYNSGKRCYDMTYVCSKYTTRLEVRKENGMIVCTLLEDPSSKWVFDHITEQAFHWRNVTVLEQGQWRTNCEVFAKRKGGK